MGKGLPDVGAAGFLCGVLFFGGRGSLLPEDITALA